MITFTINDMTCGHCVGTITKAVLAADAGARIEVGLAAHLVHIEPARASANELREAIAAAGYSPEAR